MVVRRGCVVVALSAVLAGLSSVRAAVPAVEDLTGCKLPNGRVVLPAAGTSAASNGPLYKFATNQFSSVPADATADDTLARLRASKAADIQYLPAKGGSLWAFSGAITEVRGLLYLSDSSGKKLDEPEPLPKTSRNLAGECTPIHDGGIYLLKTTDGKFVLFRLLDRTDTAAVIQYVYQENGSTTFTIPPNAPMPYRRPVDAQAAMVLPTTVPAATVVTAPVASAVSTPAVLTDMPTTAPAVNPVPVVLQPPVAPVTPVTPTPTPPTPLVATSALSATTLPASGSGDINQENLIRLANSAPNAVSPILPPPPPPSPSPARDAEIETFARQRAQILQRRVDVIYAPARTPEEIERKVQAIADLVTLRPDEPQVMDLLVAQISFFNARSASRDVSPDAQLPCFAALKRLGHAATVACLKGMRGLNLDAPGEGMESPMYKARLLGMVVRSIEGDDVAQFILRQEADRETDAKHRAVFEFLLAQ